MKVHAVAVATSLGSIAILLVVKLITKVIGVNVVMPGEGSRGGDPDQGDRPVDRWDFGGKNGTRQILHRPHFSGLA